MSSHSFCIHVRPHIRKYLSVLLAPGERLTFPLYQQVLGDMSDHLNVPVLHVKLDGPLTQEASSKLELITPSRYLSLYILRNGLEAKRCDRFNQYSEKLYGSHRNNWLDWHIGTLSVPISQGIFNWRRKYGLNADDIAYETERMGYVRYRKKQNRLQKWGGARYRKNDI